ncbi:MAG: serine/threonine protein kinase, partial [Polyangiaceae bacterium]|nr:serine/threonine protein kinase [Polyangiaceae bacterium]
MKLGDVLSGKYRLEQEIGKGAMGAVWAAYDHTSNRRVALKAILPQAREHLTTDLRQRLLREARACRKLSHRHIVQIFDVGETPEGEPFIILELLQGQTLGERIKEKRRIEPAIAARIAAEVASGLAVAHAAQVIHRDLKPANIFLHREEGMPDDLYVSKVLDFGVCKTLDSVDSVATQTGTAVGSPAYMSPEQVGMRKDLDHRTDIWSLGIVLFEMLTGSRPFSGPVQDVIRNILLTPVPPPSSKVRDVPPELDAIVARCTAGKREARFANAEELSRALFEVALTARPMTRKATFTGYGTPPALQSSPFHERPSNLPIAGVSASSPIATPPAGMGSTPEVDESEQAATLPFQGRMLMDMRPGVP